MEKRNKKGLLGDYTSHEGADEKVIGLRQGFVNFVYFYCLSCGHGKVEQITKLGAMIDRC